MQKSTLVFNRELLFGECGALLLANPAAEVVSRYTARPDLISYAAVAGTLIGGALFWVGARIYDSTRGRKLDKKALASDIGYFTPAAVLLGFAVYDPSIYFASHHLLSEGDSVMPAVFAAQAVAFLLFLLSMNLYRVVLLKTRGKRL